MKKLRSGGFLISRIHQVSSRIFNKLLKEHNITELNGAQGRILFILWKKDNISITDLVKKSMLRKSTLTSMLDKLENEGFIERVYDKKDRRKVFIRHTLKDKAFQNKVNAVSSKMIAISYDGFTESEITKFENNLKKLLNNLTEEENKRTSNVF